MTTTAIGVDFGTTNSSIARVSEAGEIELAQFPTAGSVTDAYRSLLYLEQHKERGLNSLKSWTGPEGIERYLAAETKGRLIQSLKSFLSSRNLQGTEIFGRRVTLEDLIARILRDLREKAERQFGTAINSAVVGRPVRFVGAENEADNAFAEDRLRLAFQNAGFEFVEFELEPVAAAHYYESTLDHDETHPDRGLWWRYQRFFAGPCRADGPATRTKTGRPSGKCRYRHCRRRIRFKDHPAACVARAWRRDRHALRG